MAYFLPKTKVYLHKEIKSYILLYAREKHPVVKKCINNLIDRYNGHRFLNKEDSDYYRCHQIRMYSFKEEFFKQKERCYLEDIRFDCVNFY